MKTISDEFPIDGDAVSFCVLNGEEEDLDDEDDDALDVLDDEDDGE